MYADLSARTGTTLTPTILSAPFAKIGGYNQTLGADGWTLGMTSMINNHLLFPTSRGFDANWNNQDAYAYHEYGAIGNDMAKHADNLG